MHSVLIVLPTYNEEKILKSSVLKLLDFCQKNLGNYDWQILIADNGSTDKTPQLVQELTQIYPQVLYFHINKKGRGYALKRSFLGYQADICCYMDVDLSTGLMVLPSLLEAIENGFDIAIGSRYLIDSKVKRSFFRYLYSVVYIKLAQFLLKSKITDFQCGFKAVNQRMVQDILPKVQDDKWFFDTELLILAERQGYKIKEIPVEWLDQRFEERRSKVKILRTITSYLKDVFRLKKRLKVK